jgi:hypothetical protein
MTFIDVCSSVVLLGMPIDMADDARLDDGYTKQKASWGSIDLNRPGDVPYQRGHDLLTRRSEWDRLSNFVGNTRMRGIVGGGRAMEKVQWEARLGLYRL